MSQASAIAGQTIDASTFAHARRASTSRQKSMNQDLAKFVERGIDVSEAAWNCGLSLGAQRPPGCRSVVYPGRRLTRPSHRPLISLQVDVVGHVLVNGLDDRRRRILADGIQDVSERLGQGLGTGRRALEQASG
jgi:hypothetical protein